MPVCSRRKQPATNRVHAHRAGPGQAYLLKPAHRLGRQKRSGRAAVNPNVFRFIAPQKRTINGRDVFAGRREPVLGRLAVGRCSSASGLNAAALTRVERLVRRIIVRRFEPIANPLPFVPNPGKMSDVVVDGLGLALI